MHRVLCPVETLYVGQRSRAVLSCALRGRVDVGALSTAFDAVTQAHPTLRTRIMPDGQGFVLQLLTEDERPRLITRTGGEEAYAAELNTPLPVGGPLSRAVLVSTPEGDRHLFVLVVDHTVTDGHSSITLHNAVWDHYRALVEGHESEETVVTAGAAPSDSGDGPQWPQPVSRLLPDADPTATAAYLERRVEETRRHPVELVPYDVPGPAAPSTGQNTAAAGDIDIQRLALDEELTARLRRTARQAGVSVHSLVAAALLTTARHRLGGDGPRTLGCLSPVDLRSRLSPPLPASVMVSAVTTHLQTLDVATDTDPMALARTVHTRLGDFIARADHYHEMRITPEIPRNPALQLATVIATNMGVVPGPRLPTGLHVTDIRLVPAREHYFPQAGRSPVMACVVSFEGRLAIEFPHSTACFSPAFMQAFRDNVRTGLLAFTDAAESLPALAPAR
ncbi:phthiocerol/phthiodiolone dimycocerosyl transferase family protein [Streptomyces sp. NEAU-W12]|uniref:phthiocerol/phthiodiolone dimycocerosyl transferase family protein n=1 Tax=Streptomyces sp. NEAU-W12 TaxID=2994668 RepID=UPI00224B4C34|nr:condensation domain-containing protein [Streptomyces sp. NEAU-W12]MCX2926276.1 condensation domain-containing protein [Streptomyces sp. NEAU-W12]